VLVTLGGGQALGDVEVALRDDGEAIATAGDVLTAWNAASGVRLTSYRPAQGARLGKPRWTPTARRSSSCPRRWSSRTSTGASCGVVVWTLAERGSWPARSYALTRDGTTLLTSEPCAVRARPTTLSRCTKTRAISVC
jgi:hypothetical protein